MTSTAITSTTQELLHELFDKERDHLNDFFDHLNMAAVEHIVAILSACKGMIVLTGVGKSALVAEKIAATMTSTGTRALYLSPVNALHGDIGIVSEEDVCVLLSKSGESDELLQMIPALRNKRVTMIAIVFDDNSRLAQAVDVVLRLPSIKELCPFDIAPTISTTVQAILGDVLAISLMRLKNFSREAYAQIHPAGQIGKRLTMRVSDLMLTGSSLPLCRPEDRLVDTLVELSNKQCGCILIVDTKKILLGIFTDGDLRRALQNQGAQALENEIHALMTPTPRWISPGELASHALTIMEADQKHPVTVLPVLEENRRVIGLIKMHDLLQSGI